MCHIKKNQKGISLLFIVLITSLILSIGLGLTALLIKGMRIISEIGYSVVAFYAADSGIEAALYDLYQSESPIPTHSDVSDNVDLGDAHYDTKSWCCNPDFGDCSFGGSEEPECPLSGCPPLGDCIDLNCNALNYCLESAGSYKRVKRAIEINY